MANLSGAIYTRMIFHLRDNKEEQKMIKTAVIFSVVFGSTVIISHQSKADQLQDFLIKCPVIKEDTQRLACFDEAAKNMLGSVVRALGAEERVSAVEKNKPTREDKIDDFGKGNLRVSPLKDVREKQKQVVETKLKVITLTVVKVVKTSLDKFVLYMENGQVWKQKDDGRIRLPKGDFKVEIKKGMMGSFNMIVPNRKSFIRVKRLK